MNILYVIHDNKKGGASISFLEMVNEVRKKNDVFVITPHKNGYMPKKLDDLGIRHINAHYYWWFIAMPDNKLLSWLKKTVYWVLNKTHTWEGDRIVKKLINYKFDIVHSNSSVISFGAILARKMGIPHIWHIRELAESFSLKPVDKEEKIYEFIKNNSMYMIAISEAVKEGIAGLTRASNIKIVYNGIDDRGTIEKRDFLKNAERIKFLIAGNICRDKGQEDVILATEDLIKRNSILFHVGIAGFGNTVKLEKMIREKGLEDYVSILGGIDDMVQLRRDTDVEIVASKKEPFGRVTIEAMRASNPVIGTNAGGTKELIIQNYNGFLYPYGDFKQLADYMERFIMEKDLLERMGKNAYKSVLNKFTVEENARHVMELYDKARINS